jgi:hypothetical protein
MAANLVVSFALLFLLFFLHSHSVGTLARLADDTGMMAGVIVAYFYSMKTRERAPKSVYLIAFSGAVVLLVGLALGSF